MRENVIRKERPSEQRGIGEGEGHQPRPSRAEPGSPSQTRFGLGSLEKGVLNISGVYRCVVLAILIASRL
jgi:hypothetical protein